MLPEAELRAAGAVSYDDAPREGLWSAMLTATGEHEADGAAVFALDAQPLQCGQFATEIRIFPWHELLSHPYELGYETAVRRSVQRHKIAPMPRQPARASSGRYVSRLTGGTLAVIMAGGRGERLKALTEHRCKPATPFGGKFRIIDFVLSNCVNSGIRQISILTQYKAQSLIQHVRARLELPARRVRRVRRSDPGAAADRRARGIGAPPMPCTRTSS